MSIAAINWAAAQGLRGPRQSVLAVLANHASEITGLCDLAVATIAEEAGVCLRTARAALRELEDRGKLWTQFVLGNLPGCRGQARSRYWVRFGAPKAPTEQPANAPPRVRRRRQAELDLAPPPARQTTPPRQHTPPNLLLSHLPIKFRRYAPTAKARSRLKAAFCNALEGRKKPQLDCR
jgi:hypothetical protein